MIPIPVLGTMLGSIVGGIVGEKLFTGIAKLLGYKKGQQKPEAAKASFQTYSYDNSAAKANLQVQKSSSEASKLRLPAEAEKIPYKNMDTGLRIAKDNYEIAYKAYVKAVTGGDQKAAQAKLKEFQAAKDKYQKAIKAAAR